MATDFQPYVGPRPYERDEPAPFFGRDHEADELVSLIISSWEVLFYAQSGVVKTSILNAKVTPLLEEEGFEVFPLARVQGVIPKDIQLEEIQNLYVFNTLMSWAKEEINPKRFVHMTLPEYLKERKNRTDSEGQPQPRALIFDQFEEIFTLYQDRWNDRNEFFKQVRDALKDDSRLLRVIFTIREDFIAQLDPYAPLLPEKLRTRFRIERLRRDAALAAVVGPLRETKRSFAKGVAEKLVEELLKTRVETITSDNMGKTIEIIGEFVEPVQLQVVCQNLWQELPQEVTEITEQHLLAFGDVDRQLSKFYESAVTEAATKAVIKEKELRQWCEKWLITSTGTRNIVHRGLQLTEGIPNAALDILEARHLINSEWRAGARWYELTHDRFIEPIQASNAASATIIVPFESIEILKEAVESIVIPKEAYDWGEKVSKVDIQDHDLIPNLAPRRNPTRPVAGAQTGPGSADTQPEPETTNQAADQQTTAPVQSSYASGYPLHSASEIEMLKEAYEAVRIGRLKDPQTIRDIAARFEEHVYDPDLDFYPLRTAEILYNRARLYEELNNLEGRASESETARKDHADVIVREEKGRTSVTIQFVIQPERKDLSQANDN
ncbi:MAG TPA: hypothetical protein VIX20_18340, partial [Ktedonobacteraceae bacterium]